MRKQHSKRITMLLSVTTALLTLLDPQQIRAIPDPQQEEVRVQTQEATKEWNPETATLTLNNYCYRTESPIALELPSEDEVTIHLIGSNYIEAGAAEPISIGISGTGKLRITGEGTLIVKSGEARETGAETKGLQVRRLVMESGTLVVLTGTGTESGIGVDATEGVVVEGGVLYAHTSVELGTALMVTEEAAEGSEISGISETVLMTGNVAVSGTTEPETERQKTGICQWDSEAGELLLDHYIDTYIEEVIATLPDGATIRCEGENVLTTQTGQSLLRGKDLTITGSGTLLLLQQENEAAYEEEERAAIRNTGTLTVSNQGLLCVSASSARQTAGIMTDKMQMTENLKTAVLLGGDLKTAVGEQQKRTAGVETGGLIGAGQNLTSIGGNLVTKGGGTGAGIYVREDAEEQIELKGTILAVGETAGYYQAATDQKCHLTVAEGEVQQFLAGADQEAIEIPARETNLCPGENYNFIEETQKRTYAKEEYRRGEYKNQEEKEEEVPKTEEERPDTPDSPEVPETITKPSPGRFIVILDVTGAENYKVQLGQSQEWLEQQFQTEQDRERMAEGEDVILRVMVRARKQVGRIRIQLNIAKDGEDYQKLTQKLTIIIRVQGKARHNPAKTHRRYFISRIGEGGSRYPYQDQDSSIHNIKIRTIHTGTYQLTSDQVSIGDLFSQGNYRYRVTAIKPFEAEVIGFARGRDTRHVRLKGSLVFKERYFTITAVGRKAFYRKDSVRTITMSDRIQTLKYKCFSMCSNLREATIGTGVTRIYRHILCINHNLRVVRIKSRKIRFVELPHEFLEARNCTVYVPRERRSQYTAWLIRRGLRLPRCQIKSF